MSDAKNMYRFLIGKLERQILANGIDNLTSSTDRLGFRSRDIIRLTDDAHDPRHQPTRLNILGAMRWLVRGAHKHDSLFFHCTFCP